jgi:sulfonate transport system permease protein
VRLCEGILLGGVPAILIGIAVGMFRTFEDIMAPTLRFLAPVPVLAWMPLVILFLGVDEAAKVALLAIGVFFILYAATASAVRSVDVRFIEVTRLYRKSFGQTIARVILPASTPAIFEGLRGALALSWIVLVAAEIIASRDGLGWMLWDARTFGRTVDAYVSMVVVGLLGLISDSLVRYARSRMVTWRGDFSGF